MRARCSSRVPGMIRPWRLVGVEGAGVAASQPQRCGGLPRVGEAVKPFELFDASVGAQLGEQVRHGRHPAAVAGRRQGRFANALRSARLTSWWRAGVDSIPASSTMSVAPAGSWNSARGGRSVRCHSWSSLATVSDRIPVSRSRVRAALAVGATPEHVAAVVVEVGGCGGEHAGLAGAGGSDDQHEAIVAGDRRRRLRLQHVESGAVDGVRR